MEEIVKLAKGWVYTTLALRAFSMVAMVGGAAALILGDGSLTVTVA